MLCSVNTASHTTQDSLQPVIATPVFYVKKFVTCFLPTTFPINKWKGKAKKISFKHNLVKVKVVLNFIIVTIVYHVTESDLGQKKGESEHWTH